MLYQNLTKYNSFSFSNLPWFDLFLWTGDGSKCNQEHVYTLPQQTWYGTLTTKVHSVSTCVHIHVYIRIGTSNKEGLLLSCASFQCQSMRVLCLNIHVCGKHLYYGWTLVGHSPTFVYWVIHQYAKVGLRPIRPNLHFYFLRVHVYANHTLCCKQFAPFSSRWNCL